MSYATYKSNKSYMTNLMHDIIEEYAKKKTPPVVEADLKIS